MSHASSLQGANRLILETLRQSNKPLSAYDLLSVLGAQGVKNPPTVYRALKRLITLGLAHRIASLNAFIACRQEHENDVIGFAVCRNCREVEAFEDGMLDAVIQKLGQQKSFQTEQQVIELIGICRKCTDATENGANGGETGTCSI
jgi:Fur family zinc uptake transcriptional regulator